MPEQETRQSPEVETIKIFRNMKKIKMISCLSAAAMLILSCNTKENQEPDLGNATVSDAVIAAFNARYPDAQDVSWSVRGGYAVANFSTKTKASAASGDNNAWFGNLDGVWEMTETNLTIVDLPQAVSEGYLASKYGDNTVYEPMQCDKLERRDVMLPTADGKSIVVYVIKFKTVADGSTVDVYFSEEGIIVNEIAGAPDNGYEDQLPQEPAASISQYLQANILDKGGRVIEVDAENGGTEVEAILDNRKLELYFDNAENWVYTKTDYYDVNTDTGIPAEVVATLKKSSHYSETVRVDDIEKVETNEANGSKTWWMFELETRWSEIKVYINGVSPYDELTEKPVIDMGESGGLPAGGDIEAFIKGKYPEATIAGREYDDGFLEVTIKDGGLWKELKFNAKNEWLKTEWEIKKGDMPEAVSNAVTTNGYTVSDDEVEVVETPDSKYYKVEVEKGGREYNLHIDESGNILLTENDD